MYYIIMIIIFSQRHYSLYHFMLAHPIQKSHIIIFILWPKEKKKKKKKRDTVNFDIDTDKAYRPNLFVEILSKPMKIFICNNQISKPFCVHSIYDAANNHVVTLSVCIDDLKSITPNFSIPFVLFEKIFLFRV